MSTPIIIMAIISSVVSRIFDELDNSWSLVAESGS